MKSRSFESLESLRDFTRVCETLRDFTSRKLDLNEVFVSYRVDLNDCNDSWRTANTNTTLKPIIYYYRKMHYIRPNIRSMNSEH
jgi:hypothetical protein